MKGNQGADFGSIGIDMARHLSTDFGWTVGDKSINEQIVFTLNSSKDNAYSRLRM